MSAILICEPADAAALTEFYGELPAETTRAVVARLDGRVVGIVGVAISGGYATLFSDTKPELAPYLRSMVILRAVRRSIDTAKGLGLPVLAWPCLETGARLLAREGFRSDTAERGWWRLDGDRVRT